MAMQNNGHKAYTPAQLRMVLQSIATHMAALNGLLKVAQTSEDEWERTRLVDAAQVLALGVGCLADEATGGEIVGSMGLWHCGPGFAGAGDTGGAA